MNKPKLQVLGANVGMVVVYLLFELFVLWVPLNDRSFWALVLLVALAVIPAIVWPVWPALLVALATTLSLYWLGERACAETGACLEGTMLELWAVNDPAGPICIAIVLIGSAIGYNRTRNAGIQRMTHSP